MKTFFLPIVLVATMIISCEQKSAKENNDNPSENSEIAPKPVEQRTNTYAIITTIATTDKQKFADNISQQTDQIDALWNQKTVSNIYMDSKSNEIAPTIIFFMKGKTENEVRQTLDKTNFIINGVGSYEVKPVGDLLLTMNEKSLEMKDKKNHTYSVVWDYSKKMEEIPVTIMEKQLQDETRLFETGVIENVYLNTTDDGKKRTSSVYFINADSEKDAENVLNELPLAKEKLGIYKLYDVGGFIRGEKK